MVLHKLTWFYIIEQIYNNKNTCIHTHILTYSTHINASIKDIRHAVIFILQVTKTEYAEAFYAYYK